MYARTNELFWKHYDDIKALGSVFRLRRRYTARSVFRSFNW